MSDLQTLSSPQANGLSNPDQQDPLASYQKIFRAFWEQETPKLAATHPILEPMLLHHFKSCGKLLRPALTLAFYDLFHPERTANDPFPKDVLQTALAIEILHNATLVHDDLQDGDQIRRGNPTVWKAFSPYQAINAGSALYFHAQRILLERNLKAKTIQRLCYALTQDTLQIIAGQAAEKELWGLLEKQDFSQAQQHYLEVVQGKTSALFAIPIACAAILCHMKEDSIKILEQVALPLGAFFQIQDDLLDLYGNKGRGSIGNDLAEGKPSYPVLHALYHAKEPDQKRLQELLSAPRDKSTPNEIKWAIALITQIGSQKASLQLLERLRQQAKQAVQKLPQQYQSAELTALIEHLCQKILQPIASLFPCSLASD